MPLIERLIKDLKFVGLKAKHFFKNGFKNKTKRACKRKYKRWES